jgi:hypothetical protein
VNKHTNNLKGLPASERFFTSLLAIGILAMASVSASAQDVGMIKLTYFMLGHDGMVEQDVFIESPANSNQVSRIPVSQAAKHMDTVLYASMKAPPFEPMKAEPTETYPKGAALGITLGDWLNAKGTGSYACDGKQATIKSSFQNLVPNAVYTMWNFIDLDPPTDPWQGLLVPAGTRDGSQSIFKTDARGNGTYELVIENCLQLSGTQSLAGLAIAWHNDGKTYGFSPGGLGVVSHAQLMAFFPRGNTKVSHQ